MSEAAVPKLADDDLVTVLHPGLPGGQIQARNGDVRALIAAGLIEPTDALWTTFRITDAGFAYYDAVLKPEGQR